jgi:anthranilate synthase component II
MKVLVIDNIDSFVYNLVQYVGEKGTQPIVVQNTASKYEIDAIMSSGVGRIIISPGPKSPTEAKISNYVIEKYGEKTPLLGVCLGHQCIGHVFGAKIRHAKTLMHGKTSKIIHNGGSIFSTLPNPFTAVRYHSLAVDLDTIPEDLEVMALSEEDGEIMAIKHRRYPIYGVQFHPESIETRDGMRIMENFLGAGI